MAARAHQRGVAASPAADALSSEMAPTDGIRAEETRLGTVGKLAQLLEALAMNQSGVSVRELARQTGIDKSAVSRLFEQLMDFGYADQDAASGRFRVGHRLFALAATIHGRDTLWRAAEPMVRALATTFNETCYLTTREGDEIMFRDKVDSTHNVRYVIEAGERAALHAGAGGRAVLAGLTLDEFESVLQRTVPLRGYTEHTIIDPEELRRQVNADRLRGYSMSMGERVRGGCAVSSPYFQADGACRGSIVFTCPADRFDVRRAPEIADAVSATSRQLSERLGYKPDTNR